MNKAELVAAMAEKTELSKKDAEAALKAFTDVVAEELKKRNCNCTGNSRRSPAYNYNLCFIFPLLHDSSD